MFKNTSGQKIAVFAFDYSTGAPKTGDAANISVYLSKDYGAVTQLADTSATEMDATNAKGWYLFDVSQTETNGNVLTFTGKSSTANVAVVGGTIYSRPPNFSGLTITSGRVNADAVYMGGSAVLPRYTGTAQGGNANTITLANGTTASQCGAGDVIVVTGGATASGSSGIVSGPISGAGGATPVATIIGNWNGTNPANGSTYEILKVGGIVPALSTDLASATQANTIYTFLTSVPSVNIQKINNTTVVGTGKNYDKWRG